MKIKLKKFKINIICQSCGSNENIQLGIINDGDTFKLICSKCSNTETFDRTNRVFDVT